MKKKKWLSEMLFVDVFGRPSSLSDVPMTYMTREKSFEKRGYGKKMIKQLWKEDLEDVKAIKEELYER